jgi:uncharacterized protein
MEVARPTLEKHIAAAIKRSPVVTLLGPRQCGKTTLARRLQEQRGATYFDLEDPRDAARLQNPGLILSPLTGLVILDEIQLRPDLMPLLRVLADRNPVPCRFLLLGSASPDLSRQTSETLAGRIEFVEMGGFSLTEIDSTSQLTLWLRGGFPDSFLADNNTESMIWRENFIRTFLERDIPRLGIQIPPLTLRRFWMMVAHYHGQIWNGAEIGSSLGVTHPTTRKYLDLLTGAFVLRQLPPWFENMGKRTVKSPKVYVRDTGLLHTLLNISSHDELSGHPKLGASWEGFVVEQLLALLPERHTYFWATHGGAELDVLYIAGGKRYGFECKYTDSPRSTKSMRIALDDLKLDHLWVVYPGTDRYPLDEYITVIPAGDIPGVASQLTT